MSDLGMDDAAVMGMFLATVSRDTDSDLVARFQAGDSAVFSEIVRRYQHRVYTLALRWMRNPAIAEEVAQDVFIALYRSLHSFRGDAKLSTWVYRVVVNHSKNRIQYRSRRRMTQHDPIHPPSSDEERPLRQLASDEAGPDAGQHRHDAQRIVTEGLAQLDEEQRMIVTLRDIEDLSYEEISAILDIPRGTVKSRLHRARLQLAAVVSRQITHEDVR